MDPPPTIMNRVWYVFNLRGMQANHFLNPWWLKKNAAAISKEDDISLLKIEIVSLFGCYELVEREIV